MRAARGRTEIEAIGAEIIDGSIKVHSTAVKALHPIHEAQLLSYLKLSGHRLGFLINFHVVHLRDGIKRMVNNL